MEVHPFTEMASDPGEARRVEFQTLLEKILGSRNVYYQPPSETKLKFPCIVYQLDDIYARHADNVRYRHMRRYKTTYIDREPNMKVPELIARIPMSSFNRFYTSDNLNYYVYRVYF